MEIRCQFVFSGKNDELTPDFLGYCGEYFDYSLRVPQRFNACEMKDLLAN